METSLSLALSLRGEGLRVRDLGVRDLPRSGIGERADILSRLFFFGQIKKMKRRRKEVGRDVTQGRDSEVGAEIRRYVYDR
jgi:hypothetical protein